MGPKLALLINRLFFRWLSTEMYSPPEALTDSGDYVG